MCSCLCFCSSWLKMAAGGAAQPSWLEGLGTEVSGARCRVYLLSFSRLLEETLAAAEESTSNLLLLPGQFLQHLLHKINCRLDCRLDCRLIVVYLSCAVGLRLETPWIAQRSSHADQQSSHSQSLAALAKPRATHHILVLGGATSCSHVPTHVSSFSVF